MGFDMIGFIIAAFVTTVTLLASDMQLLVFGKSSLVGENWTANDFWDMAKTKQVAAAVKVLTSEAYESGAPVALQVERIRDAIDAATEENIRVALLMQADGGGDRKKDPLGAFAKTINAAVTCGTSGTAGGDGLDLCVDRCERKPHWLAFKTPRRGGCYLLCSLAVAPCVNEPFSWEDFSNNWVAPSTSLVMSVKTQVAVQVEVMTPEFNRMAVEVKTMAILAHGKGMEMARDVAASKAMADLSLLVFAAADALQTPRALKIMFLLLVSFAYGHYAKTACRAVRATTSEMERRMKVALGEVKRLKLRRLVMIRANLLKQDGFYGIHDVGAWAIYHASVKAAEAERLKVGCQLLEGLACGRMKRAMTTRLVQWNMAAATMSAAIDAAPSEDEDEKDQGAG